MTPLAALHYDNRYVQLPDCCYSRVTPAPQGNPRLLAFNPQVAALLGLDPAAVADEPELAQYLGGYRLLPQWQPIATVYSGHQFGVYVPRLGDGRALLLGEVIHNNQRWELQLKGSGPTPYSRMGDGYAVLRSTIREYLCSEAMVGLGIPSSRALAVVATDAPVYRERAETGAVLTRLAPSHVRFGSFEYFFHTKQHTALRQLADHVIDLHYPACRELAAPERYAAWFQEVVAATARLMAQWQAVGFVHGVMNTDNLSIHGITIDYGPFEFLNTYRPDHVGNHSDHTGRYAYNRQPHIALWNLGCLAQALLPLLEEPALRDALEGYAPVFNDDYLALMAAKLGLTNPQEEDMPLIHDWLALLATAGADFTNSFRDLSGLTLEGSVPLALQQHFTGHETTLTNWVAAYRQRLRAEGSADGPRRERMQRVNPRYILRTHLAQQAIEAAEQGDNREITTLQTLLTRPFDEQPEYAAYAATPPAWAENIALSCSS